MRFTAAKETRNPNAHLIGIACNPLLIGFEEVAKVLLQFASYHIFFQLLLDVLVIVLPDLDDPFQISLNSFREHLSDFHNFSSPFLLD